MALVINGPFPAACITNVAIIVFNLLRRPCSIVCSAMYTPAELFTQSAHRSVARMDVHNKDLSCTILLIHNNMIHFYLSVERRLLTGYTCVVAQLAVKPSECPLYEVAVL